MSLSKPELKLRGALAKVYSSPALFFLYTLLIAHMLFSGWPAIDPDLFARLAVGKWVAEYGAVPTVDVFAWTPKLERWIDHEWLSGVVFYQLYQIGGDSLLYLFKILVAAATVLMLRNCCATRGASVGAALVFIGLGFFAASFLWFGTVRCQIFTYLFLAGVYYAICMHRYHGARFPMLIGVVLMGLWTNLHGGFVLGLIALMCYGCVRVVEKSNQSWFPFGCFCAAVSLTLINPYGIEYWRFILSALSKERPAIAEWNSVSLLSLQGLVLAIYGGIIGIYSISDEERAKGWGRFLHESYLLTFFSFYCGFRHARLLPLALFASLAFFPQALDHATAKIQPAARYLMIDRILNILAAIVTIPALVSFTHFVLTPESFRGDYRRYPVSAISWAVENLPSGKMLNSFNEGSYLLWKGYPDLLISIDGRYEEVYPEETFAKNAAIYSPNASNRAQLVSAWAPDYILAPNDNLYQTKSFGAEWVEAYRDLEWKILKRGEPGHDPSSP